MKSITKKQSQGRKERAGSRSRILATIKRIGVGSVPIHRISNKILMEKIIVKNTTEQTSQKSGKNYLIVELADGRSASCWQTEQFDYFNAAAGTGKAIDVFISQKGQYLNIYRDAPQARSSGSFSGRDEQIARLSEQKRVGIITSVAANNATEIVKQAPLARDQKQAEWKLWFEFIKQALNGK